MEAIFQTVTTGLPILILHLGTAAIVLVIGILVYTRLTPHKELHLIQQGNVAAGVSLGAAIIGLSIPVAVTLATGVSVADIAIWGMATLLLQLILFSATDLLLRGLSKRIVKGEMAAASLLAAIKIAGSLLLSASLVG